MSETSSRREALRLIIAAALACAAGSGAGAANAADAYDPAPYAEVDGLKAKFIDVAGQLDIDDRLRLAIFRQIDPGQRRAPSERNAQVEEIGMFWRARAEHRIGEDDSVRLRPGDAFTGPRCAVEQIWRAGEAGAASHADIGIGQSRSGQAT